MECQIQNKTINIKTKTLRKNQFKTAETFQTALEAIVVDSITQMGVVLNQRYQVRHKEFQAKAALQECRKFSHGAMI